MTFTDWSRQKKAEEIPESILNARDATELLREAVRLYGNRIALASSFGLEDVVLIHMLCIDQRNNACRVFAIDTGRLPEETYQCAEAIRRKYGIEIEWVFPDKTLLEEMISSKGLYSFKESNKDRLECCYIRKVEPLERSLQSLDAWITGQRRDQSQTRAQLQMVEIDRAHASILKLNPLYNWSYESVLEYVRENNIPYNRLFDLGYKSIGCAPCTRPVGPDEHERAGRWWWESEEHKECGLHLTNSHVTTKVNVQ